MRTRIIFNTTHSYQTEGVYNVLLTVKDNSNGCKDTVSKWVVVKDIYNVIIPNICFISSLTSVIYILFVII